MAEFLNWQLARFIVFLMLFVRVLAVFSVAPVVGSRAVPFPLRGALALGLALILTVGMPHVAVQYTTGMGLLWAAIQEALLGVAIGFIALLLFEALQVAGEVMGMQIGFALADIVDPITSENTSLVGQIYYLLATLVFVLIDGPMMIVTSLHGSFAHVPPGTALASADSGRAIVELFSVVLLAAVQFAAPIVVSMLLVSIAMGVIGRTVPQFNILFVGIPVRTLIGLAVMVLALQYTVYRLVGLIELLPGEIETVVAGFAG
ncbi:flagellar biosynthetic protein FliR [bacterium]|nr:flagellar biosynthetic protein FliR [bacterium]